MKTESRHIERVRMVLLSQWDPLGVGDNPRLKSEYDSYVLSILELILKKAGRDQIATRLREIRCNDISLPENNVEDEKAASCLLELDLTSVGPLGAECNRPNKPVPPSRAT